MKKIWNWINLVFGILSIPYGIYVLCHLAEFKTNNPSNYWMGIIIISIMIFDAGISLAFDYANKIKNN